MPIPNSSSKSALLLLTILGALIVSTLVVISSYFLRPIIEHELKKELLIGLSQVGITTSNIYISGRDVTLYGVITNKSKAIKAEKLAKEIWGVRQVTNKLLIKKPITE